MFQLLRHFSIASAIALTVVTSVLVYLYRDTAVEELLVSAERANGALARPFSNILWPRFSDYVMTVTETDGDRLRARPETAKIDQAVRILTAGLAVLKVKIYNLDGLTVYSSEPSQIGINKGNHRGFLQSAREGMPDSKLSFRETFSAFTGEVLNRDLVESYLPIWGKDGAVEGVFELYTDVTPLVARVNGFTKKLLAGLLLAFAFLYGVLFLVVRRADHIIRSQYADLLDKMEAHRATEEILARNSQLLETTLEHMAQGIVVFGADHKLLASNKHFNEMFGFPPGFIHPGKTHEDIMRFRVKMGHFGPGDEKALTRERVELGKNATERTNERTLPNGTTFVYHRKPMPGGGAVVTYTDITARRRIQEELAHKSALLETTLENMSHGISVLDSDFRLLAFNQKCVELRDYPPGFLRLGMPVEQLYRYKAERGYYGPGNVDAQVAECMEKKRRQTTGRKERIRSDGKVIAVDRELMPDGAWVTTYTDITESKKAEAELIRQSALLETTYQNMAQGFAVFDADGRLTAFNEKYVEFSGFDADAVRLDMPYDEVARLRGRMEKHEGHGFEAKVAVRVASAMSGEVARNELTRADGTAYIYQRQPLPEGGFVMTLTDITARKAAEEKTRQAMEQAESASRSKSEFLANMSHELRTPLNSIIGFSELMMTNNTGPMSKEKFVEFSADINASGHHLLSLINDILDLSKIEAGKVELKEEAFDPARVVRSCLNSMKAQASGQGIALAAEIPDPLLPLYADQRVLKQIILNLLSNALKFTPEGGKVILKAWSLPNTGHVLQVIDTGVGVALNDIPKILKPFIQVEGDLSRKHQGTGLGLSLCKNLIELHGGYLDFQSEIGTGSTVTVRFPKERIATPRAGAVGENSVAV